MKKKPRTVDEEEPVVVDIKDSILNSVKKQLGLFPEVTDFDPDIIMHINAGIATLQQIGVGPQDLLFLVEDNTQTYDDFLGPGCEETPFVKQYLFYKTKMMFNPSSSGTIQESLKSQISEIEWRLMTQVENKNYKGGGCYFQNG